MASLRQAVANIRRRSGSPQAGNVSVRLLLSQYTITPSNSVRALLASDQIETEYEASGRAAGPMGLPMSGVRLTDFGAVQPFSSGLMGIRSGKLDTETLYQAQVRFLGFRCNEESNHDQSTPSDEPYFIISITGFNNTTHLFGPYDDVDGGESRFTTADDDVLKNDVQLPFTLSVVAMENDEGTPADAARKVENSCREAIQVAQRISLASYNAQALAVVVAVNTVFTEVGDSLSKAVSAVLGLEDDFVGSGSRRIGDWNDGEKEWRTPDRQIEDPSFSPDPYNVKINVGDGDEGNYSLYFNINIFKIEKTPIPPNHG